MYKFAHQPYPENATSHYMPDIRPDQKFITDQDPEFYKILLRGEKKFEKEKKAKKGQENDASDDSEGSPPIKKVKAEARGHSIFQI